MFQLPSLQRMVGGLFSFVLRRWVLTAATVAICAIFAAKTAASLIEAEDPKAILSDDALVDLLRAKGFDLARRTVAKYREAIGLGSSVQRRRQKALAAVR